MLKNILNIGKPLSKNEQQLINGGSTPQSSNSGNEPESEACFHCGIWVPCHLGFDDSIPCGIIPAP
jgi:hypothetical protein